MPDTLTTWADILSEEKTQPYFKSILQFLAQEKKAGKIIYPAQNELFNAFKETSYEQVKADAYRIRFRQIIQTGAEIS